MGISKSLAILSWVVLIIAIGWTQPSNAQELTRVPVVNGEPIPPQKTHSQLPALIVRPSTYHSKDLNDCVVEMQPSKTSKSQVSLKIMIPDSVSMIEVVPNQAAGASRNFRIQVDQKNSDNKRDKVALGNRSRRSSNELLSKQKSKRFTKNPFFYVAGNPAPPTKITQTSAKAMPFSAMPIRNAAYSVESGAVSVKPAQQCTFEGPAEVRLGEKSNFNFSIPHFPNSKSISVELSVSDGLEISVVDRKVLVDQLNRTMNWHVDTDNLQGPISIHFQTIARKAGYFTQKAKIKVDGELFKSFELGSVVKQGADTTDAPLLPFEK